MKRRIQTFIVDGLDWLCMILDNIPTIERADHGDPVRFYRVGGWGCRAGIALKAFDLQDRWGL